MEACTRPLLTWLDTLTTSKRLQRIIESDSLLFPYIYTIGGLWEVSRDPEGEPWRHLHQLTTHYWRLLMMALPRVNDGSENFASRLGLLTCQKTYGQFLKLLKNTKPVIYDNGGFLDTYGRFRDLADVHDQVNGMGDAWDRLTRPSQDH